MFNKPKSKKKTPTSNITKTYAKYHFMVSFQDSYSAEIRITKNDEPYCIYYSERDIFFNPNGLGYAHIPMNEKKILLDFISAHYTTINNAFLCI